MCTLVHPSVLVKDEDRNYFPVIATNQLQPFADILLTYAPIMAVTEPYFGWVPPE